MYIFHVYIIFTCKYLFEGRPVFFFLRLHFLGARPPSCDFNDFDVIGEFKGSKGCMFDVFDGSFDVFDARLMCLM